MSHICTGLLKEKNEKKEEKNRRDFFPYWKLPWSRIPQAGSGLLLKFCSGITFWPSIKWLTLESYKISLSWTSLQCVHFHRLWLLHSLNMGTFSGFPNCKLILTFPMSGQQQSCVNKWPVAIIFFNSPYWFHFAVCLPDISKASLGTGETLECLSDRVRQVMILGWGGRSVLVWAGKELIFFFFCSHMFWLCDENGVDNTPAFLSRALRASRLFLLPDCPNGSAQGVGRGQHSWPKRLQSMQCHVQHINLGKEEERRHSGSWYLSYQAPWWSPAFLDLAEHLLASGKWWIHSLFCFCFTH